MNRTAHLTRQAALGLVLAASSVLALAQTAPADQPLTRAQVVAELQRARSSGELEQLQKDSGGYGALELNRHAAKGLTRAQVLNDLQRARQTGELEQLQAETGGYGRLELNARRGDRFVTPAVVAASAQPRV